MASYDEPNGWDESAKLVFSELKRLSDGQDRVMTAQQELAIVAARMDEKLDGLAGLPDRVNELEREQAKQKVKAGFIATGITILTTILLKVFGVGIGDP